MWCSDGTLETIILTPPPPWHTHTHVSTFTSHYMTPHWSTVRADRRVGWSPHGSIKPCRGPVRSLASVGLSERGGAELMQIGLWSDAAVAALYSEWHHTERLRCDCHDSVGCLSVLRVGLKIFQSKKVRKTTGSNQNQCFYSVPNTSDNLTTRLKTLTASVKKWSQDKCPHSLKKEKIKLTFWPIY